MTMNLAVFISAAALEIARCFAFWAWLRRGASPLVVVLGVGCLIGFACALTRVDTAFAGRAYAAYGGIYIVASLVWLWLVEGAAPDRQRSGWRSGRHRRSAADHRPRAETALGPGFVNQTIASVV